jgi:hypothetical protein
MVAPMGNQFLAVACSPGDVLNLVPAASNTAGLYIRTMQVTSYGGDEGGGIYIYADTSAPGTPVPDVSKRIIFNLQSGQNIIQGASIPYPLFVPAGNGLWAAVLSVNLENEGIIMTYDLLS